MKKPVESSLPSFFLTSSPSWHLSRAWSNEVNFYNVNPKKQYTNSETSKGNQTTSQICSSVYSSSGSRLLRTVPSNMVGSWGMMLNLDRKSCSPIEEMLMPSIRTWPAAGSTMRKSVCIRVDLPLPVLPTIPVFIPPGKVHVRPRNTSGMCRAYRTYIHAQEIHQQINSYQHNTQAVKG